MKYLIILLGYLTLSQATLFSFLNFWRRPSVNIETETIPVTSNEHYNSEEAPLYNQIYSTNGFGYYPSQQQQQIHYPTIYTSAHLPIQSISSPQFLTYSPQSSAVHILPNNQQPIIVPEIQTLTEEIKTPLHATVDYAAPVVEHEIIHQDELPLQELPINYQNSGTYLTETHPSTDIYLTPPQLDGVPGQYAHSYILSDGTKVFEEGHLKKSLNGNEVIVKSGNYEYKTTNGEIHKVNWIADEDGFRILE